MLNIIKSIIAEKVAFQESADIILENDDLDDEIILNGEEKDSGADDVDDNEDKDDDFNTSNEGEAEPNPEPQEEESEDEELPEPVGTQTGEPIKDANDDILSMEVDMTSNTVKDILPYPPANAGDAVNDDSILNQRIDTGFGKDSNTSDNTSDENSILNDKIEPPEDEEEPEDLMTEAIKLDDDEPAPDGENKEENSVTQAVKDKVAEAEQDEESAAESETPPTGDTGSSDDADDLMNDTIDNPTSSDDPNAENDGKSVDKKELFNKLTSLTTGIEDVKNQLVNSMN